jgi:hypothetical protein
MTHDLTRNPLETSLNLAHDTKHSNKTTCITIWIHRMILDMIQGCRYLRRSTDRWFPSKNSTTRLKDSKVWRKAGFVVKLFDTHYRHQGFIFIPCPNTTPDRLRVQHLIPKLMLRRQCPSRTRHQFVLSFYPGHVITHSWKLPLKSANSPFVERWHIANRRHLYRILWGDFSCWTVFCYQTRPTNQSLSSTNFWC